VTISNKKTIFIKVTYINSAIFSFLIVQNYVANFKTNGNIVTLDNITTKLDLIVRICGMLFCAAEKKPTGRYGGAPMRLNRHKQWVITTLYRE